MAVSLRHLILGLLDVSPMSGYDLKKSFDGSVAHFWSADQSQIYRALAALEADGLVTSTTIPQTGRPDRREHVPTEEGRRELAAWLRTPLESERPREPFLGRLFFAGREGDTDLVRRLLAERREAAEAALVQLRALPGADRDLASRLREATRRNGIRHLEAELEWLDETRAAL